MTPRGLVSAAIASAVLWALIVALVALALGWRP